MNHLQLLINQIADLPQTAPTIHEKVWKLLKRYNRTLSPTKSAKPGDAPTADAAKKLSKTTLLATYKQMVSNGEIRLSPTKERNFLTNIKTKVTRTISGVTPVTVLTKPFPCPGKCIFCPSDYRMPKSYLSSEPGAQRAAANKFDPYMQAYNRLVAYKNMGHGTDKVELIILGGTWSAYPDDYQRWFVKRCFDAMNDFEPEKSSEQITLTNTLPYSEEGLSRHKSLKLYNKVVAKAMLRDSSEVCSWRELEAAHTKNETAYSRCVGLVIETRPDEITEEEVVNIRRLGATKVQLGVQSLNNKVLRLNKRGHDVARTARAFTLLRSAGFKLHVHWMPNLYGSTPEADKKDFIKLFKDSRFRPDELKIYPCSLIESADLYDYYKKGLWKPYTLEELTAVLSFCLAHVPNYCRVTRVIRDISSDDIAVGNKLTNLRQIVEAYVKKSGGTLKDIHSREVRGRVVSAGELALRKTRYITKGSAEYFLEFTGASDCIAGFLRLSLPKPATPTFIQEISKAAIIREIHVYGQAVNIGDKQQGKVQHLGLGKKLIAEAKLLAGSQGFRKLVVISSVGTREYYKKNGFVKDGLYQSMSL